MKKFALRFASFLAIITLVSQSTAQACTTFCLFNGKDLIFGRNYDFPIGYGHIVINKRGVFKSAVDYAFDILRNVAQGSHTQWSIVYDVRNLAVHFYTNKAPQERHMNLKSFDFACASPVKILDVNADISGNIASHFSNYTTEANRQLVMASFQNSPFTKHIPVSTLEEIARHPESGSCRHLDGSPAKVNATTTSTQQ
jgi:penicillin V acylase-like amidase (Ntn superfamily)